MNTKILDFFHHKRGPFGDISKYLTNNSRIIEAGAHIGLDTIKLAKLFPQGMIYAFEPVDYLYKQLKINTKTYTNVSVHNLALGNKNRIEEIFLSEGESDGSSSLLQPKEHLLAHPKVLFKQKQKVTCTTIESWSKKNHIERVDFFWLDLQGFELQVLKNAGKILNTTKVIYSEVSLIETYKNVAIYSELKSWLENRGFYVKKEYIYWKDAGNVLFLRDS